MGGALVMAGVIVIVSSGTSSSLLYTKPCKKPCHPDGETNKFIFDCGVLLTEQQNFTLQADELDDFAFKPLSEAVKLISNKMRRRLEAIQQGIFYYEI